MTFTQAVRFFRNAGFEVEPGPGSIEVTLRIVGDDFVTTNVVPFKLLPAMADVAAPLFVRNHVGNVQPKLVA